MVICLNYGHFEKKLKSVIISQNHYLNQILDVYPLNSHPFYCGCFMQDAMQKAKHMGFLGVYSSLAKYRKVFYFFLQNVRSLGK